MYHLKEIPHAAPGGLDLNVADEEEFSPDKLRSNIERLYMTVIISLLAFGKQIARLRSWRERRRTTYFCIVCDSPHMCAQARLTYAGLLRCVGSGSARPDVCDDDDGAHS